MQASSHQLLLCSARSPSMPSDLERTTAWIVPPAETQCPPQAPRAAMVFWGGADRAVRMPHALRLRADRRAPERAEFGDESRDKVSLVSLTMPVRSAQQASLARACIHTRARFCLPSSNHGRRMLRSRILAQIAEGPALQGFATARYMHMRISSGVRTLAQIPAVEFKSPR